MQSFTKSSFRPLTGDPCTSAQRRERRLMKKAWAITGLCLAFSGCGTYPLGRAFPQNGETQDQVRLAVLDCQDRAKNEANSDGRVAAAFIAGLTIVGAPIAIAEERRKTREVWHDCMKAKGYRVEAPDDAPTAKYVPAGPGKSYETSPPITKSAVPESTPTPPARAATPAVAAAIAPTPTPKNVTLQLEKLQELRSKGLITEVEFQDKRKAILDSL